MARDGAQEFVDAVVQLMGPVTAGYLAEVVATRRSRIGCTGQPAARAGQGDRGTTRRSRWRPSSSTVTLGRGDRARRRGPRRRARTGRTTLTALRYVTDEITAIVTVADDDGSSGRLRDEFGVLPPGDLRMALAALCAESEWGHTWRDVAQHRFAGDGPLGGHALGNLLIVALWELHDDPVAGLDLVGRLLQAQGRVLPMAAVHWRSRQT